LNVDPGQNTLNVTKDNLVDANEGGTVTASIIKQSLPGPRRRITALAALIRGIEEYRMRW